jgi:hypothetical protein
VRRRITSTDGLIGFLLRREEQRDGSWSTSDYVGQEIQFALAHRRQVIPVLEDGVPRPGGFLQHLQFLPYRADERDRFLLALAGHVREWVQGEVKIRLGPKELLDDLARDLQRHAAVCHYRVMHDYRTEREGTAEILAEGGGMFTKLLGFGPGRLVELKITAAGSDWASTLLPHTQPFADVLLDRVRP